MSGAADWDEEYILHNLPLGEFDWFDAKGRRALDLTIDTVSRAHVRENLSKAISAFANSGGGQIVFGLADPDPAVGRWEIDHGGIRTNGPNGDVREWLETLIPNLVTHPLQAFNVYQILPTSEASYISEGCALYIIDIEDSELAPHQAQDGRYYARVAGRSRPLGHQQVSDVFNRRQVPIVNVSMEVERTLWVSVPSYRLNLNVANNGRVYAEYIYLEIYIPSQIAGTYVTQVPTRNLDGNSVFMLNNKFRDITGVRENQTQIPQQMTFIPNYVPTPPPEYFGIHRFEPLLPSMVYHWSLPLIANFNIQNFHTSEGNISWNAYVDNAPLRQGFTPINQIPFIDNAEN